MTVGSRDKHDIGLSAIDVHEQSLLLRRATGNVWGEARSQRGLALAHRGLGDHHRALEHLRAALTCFQLTNDRTAEAHTLADLGDTHHAAGDDESAIEAWKAALPLLTEPGDPLAAIVRSHLDASGS